MLIFFDKNLVSKYFDIFLEFLFYILRPEVEVSKAAPRKLESDHLPISPHRHRDNFSVAVKALLGQNITISIAFSPQIFKNHLISCLFSVFHHQFTQMQTFLQIFLIISQTEVISFPLTFVSYLKMFNNLNTGF